jgi:hypothetical protein
MLKGSAATSDALAWAILHRMSLQPNGTRLTGVAGLRLARSCGPLTAWCIDKRHRLVDLLASARQFAQSRHFDSTFVRGKAYGIVPAAATLGRPRVRPQEGLCVSPAPSPEARR